MAIDERTATRHYLLPSPSNKLKDDVERLRSALSAIDGDVTDILLELGLRAATEHVHDIEDVTGLQAALDDKVSASGFSLDLDNLADVNAPAPTGNQVLMRVGSFWIPANLQVNHVTGLESALTAVGDAMGAKWDDSTVAAAPSKANPLDSDVIALVDASLKKLTWANVKAAIGTALGGLVAAATSKPTMVDADSFMLADSAASNATRKTTLGNLKVVLAATFGKKATVSAAAPSGGVDGDVWYQV